jgi:long-subunit acyl-CoA synthetase (AMP-forming)
MSTELPFSTAELNEEVKVRLGSQGVSAYEPKTVMQHFDATVLQNGDKPALHQKIVAPGQTAEATPWTTWTWKQYRSNVDDFGKALISQGFERFDTINIIGFNR